MVVLLSVLVSAEANQESTQQFNKIYLNPFYRVSLAVNTNVTYNVTVNPPDKISSVVNAMLAFNIQVNGQTQTLTAWVNGRSCNNPTYSIATAFSTTGQLQAYFDCSNVITTAGVYNVTLKSAVATGAVSGWLDLTYMNSPRGGVNVHGTEYIGGDVGKLFLQFLDANNNAVSNSECFVSLWYPNDTLMINNSLMSKLQNASDGIYYKNFNVPYVTGVYPASARCYRPLTFYNMILYNYAYENWETNTWTSTNQGWATCPLGDADCQSGWDREDTVPLSFIITNASAKGPCYAGLYCALITGSYGFIERGVNFPEGTAFINVTYYWKYSGWQTNEHFDFYVFDGNWHLIDAHDKNDGAANTWIKDNYLLDTSEFELDGGTILIGWYATKDSPSTSDEYYLDNISIHVIAANITFDPNSLEYQVLRGAGEVHVSNMYSQLNASIGGIQASVGTNLSNDVASAVWNYTNRSAMTDTLFVGGTEYVPLAPGKIAARVISNGNPVASAVCTVNIAYPNMTLFINSGNMTEYVSIGNGVYVYNFTAPNVTGVYPYAVDCTKGGSKYYLLDTFHVENTATTSNIASSVWNYTGTISSNILTQIAQAISDFYGAVLQMVS
jgi:hypothetical protein